MQQTEEILNLSSENFCTPEEKAKEWGISALTIRNLCRDGRIVGAIKPPHSDWLIPKTSTKPTDRRKKENNEFTFIDLFCGIGGFHQAMSALGGRCVFACDINTSCREVYTNNFCPDEQFPVEGDIKKAIRDGIIPKFDVLCAGFPCQTFSKAGLQNGFDVVEKDNGEKDERGQLFYRIIDILQVHPECKYIVLENVRNLADKKDNWAVICNELKAQDFIITEEPIIESPHHFGIPQVRERVFILGIRKSAFDKRIKLPQGFLTRELLHIDELLNPCAENGDCLTEILEKDVPSKYFVPNDIEELLNIWEEFRTNIHGLMSPFWLHKAGLGIYDDEEFKHNQDIGYLEMPDWKKELVDRTRKMYKTNTAFIDDWVRRHHMCDRFLIHQKFEWNAGKDCSSIKDGIIQIRQSGVRVKRPNYFPSLVAMKNTPIVWDKYTKHFRYITPYEAAKLQSFSKGYKFSESDATTYRQLGNSVNVELLRMFSQQLFKLGKRT